MGKIACRCGHIISDTSDNLPYKGYIIPDVEMEGLYDLFENRINSLVDAILAGRRKDWINEHLSNSYPQVLDHSSLLNDVLIQKLININQDIFECEKCGRVAIQIGQDNMFKFYSPDENDGKCILNKK